MASNTSVLILGLGELGTAVVHALTAHPQRGLNTIAILRRPGTLSTSDPVRQAEISQLESLGASTPAGDILEDSESELSALFAPFDTIIGCTGMYFPTGIQLKLARAVLGANVRRYLPWQFGVDYDAIGRGSSQDLFSEQLGVRDLLRQQSATEWTVVSTGIFMSFLFEPAFGVVDEDRKVVRALGDWQNRVTVTTVQDIGLVVAELIWVAPNVYGVIYVSGDTVSYEQVADLVQMIQGKKTEREQWTVESLKEELAKDPSNGMKKYRVVFAEGRGVAWDQDVTFNEKRGIKLQDVESWAVERFR
jgi:hypothetical protein